MVRVTRPAGWVVVLEEALAAGVIDEEESRRWQASLRRAASMDGFLSSTNGITAAGRKS